MHSTRSPQSSTRLHPTFVALLLTALCVSFVLAVSVPTSASAQTADSTDSALQQTRSFVEQAYFDRPASRRSAYRSDRRLQVRVEPLPIGGNGPGGNNPGDNPGNDPGEPGPPFQVFGWERIDGTDFVFTPYRVGIGTREPRTQIDLPEGTLHLGPGAPASDARLSLSAAERTALSIQSEGASVGTASRLSVGNRSTGQALELGLEKTGASTSQGRLRQSVGGAWYDQLRVTPERELQFQTATSAGAGGFGGAVFGDDVVFEEEVEFEGGLEADTLRGLRAVIPEDTLLIDGPARLRGAAFGDEVTFEAPVDFERGLSVDTVQDLRALRPVNTLQVDGPARFVPTEATSMGIALRQPDGGGGAEATFEAGDGTTLWRLGIAGEGDYGFRLVDPALPDSAQQLVAVERSGNVLLAPTGNVGIGTASPDSAKLEVDGTIRARRVRVTSDGWADDVFEDEYDLRSLADLARFIDENGHLPGMPTTEQATTVGFSLGAMDARLLRQVEELVLYAIDQEEQTSALTTQIDAQQAQLRQQQTQIEAQESQIEKQQAQIEAQQAQIERLLNAQSKQ